MTVTKKKILASFVMIVMLGWSAGASAAAKEASRLRILFVVDNEGLNTTLDTISSYHEIIKVIGTFKAKHENRFSWEILRGNQASPANVLNYYRHGLKDLKRSESLLFFYWGHGAWDTNRGPNGQEKGHFLAMKAGNLYRSELRSAMVARKPFATFILTDCCSVVLGVEPPRRGNGAFAPVAALPQRKKPKWQTFRDLFFKHRGLVDIQAATRGEFGWGGMFMNAFAGLLCETRRSLRVDRRDGFVSWAQFFPWLQIRTLQLFAKAQYDLAAARVAYRTNPATGKPEDIRNYRAQTPMYFDLAFNRRGASNRLRAS